MERDPNWFNSVKASFKELGELKLSEVLEIIENPKKSKVTFFYLFAF